MYAGHIACCPLVSHGEYELCAPLKLEKKTGETDGWTPDHYVTLTARHCKRNKVLTGRNTTGPPCKVGRPTARLRRPSTLSTAGRPCPPAAFPLRVPTLPAALQTTTTMTMTDASQQNNTGPLGGPVIIPYNSRKLC